ncbi:MAG: hypothetical protein PHV74_10830 [Dehalococcoidia bacterium]|nr:hypothetical protein [Dehalococcoidia bacterium]
MEDIENRRYILWLREMEALLSEKAGGRTRSGQDEVMDEFTETVADLEKSAAFGERLKTINGEIERQLITDNNELEV